MIRVRKDFVFTFDIIIYVWHRIAKTQETNLKPTLKVSIKLWWREFPALNVILKLTSKNILKQKTINVKLLSRVHNEFEKHNDLTINKCKLGVKTYFLPMSIWLLSCC